MTHLKLRIVLRLAVFSGLFACSAHSPAPLSEPARAATATTEAQPAAPTPAPEQMWLAGEECAHTVTAFHCVTYLRNYDGDTITFEIPGVHPLLGHQIGVRIRNIDKLMTNATRTISAARPGFARTVANSLAARLELLQERGLAHGSTLAPDLMRTLYASELAQFHREEGRRYGLQRAFQPDVAAVGRLEVRDLPSGPHALLIERGGYRLTPLRPQMVSLIGHEVELALSAEAAAQPHRRAARVEVKLATPSQERSR